MNTIRIDFSKSNNNKFSTLLLLLAMTMLAACVYKTLSERTKNNKLESTLTNIKNKKQNTIQRTQTPILSNNERSSANKIIRLLNQPWNDLFNALEVENHDKITLLSLTPNSETRQIIIQAECDNIDEAVAYIKKLNSEKIISRAILTHQEKTILDSKQTIRIVVEASWQTN